MRRLTLAAILLPFALNLLAQHPTGVLEPTPERRQWIAENVEEWTPRRQTRGPLPSQVINTAHLPQVWTQGQLGICGSFAPTYYVRNYYESKARDEGRWDPESAADRKKLVSPMWSVLVSEHGGDTDGPDGGDIFEACETLCNHGYLTLDELDFTGTTPEDGYRFPSAEMQRRALKRKGGVPVTISDIRTEAGLLKLKQALAEGDIFVTSCSRLPKNFDHFPNETETVEANGQPIKSNNHGIFVWPNTTGISRAGHAFTIIGYDDTIEYTNKEGETRHGALRIVNSWGTLWADGGYLWIAYDAFMKYGFFGGVLGGTAYSFRDITAREDYTPERTAVVTYSNEGNPLEHPWMQTMGSVYRFWPQGFDYQANGLPLDNIAPSNCYLIGTEEDVTKVEILLDLNGLENAPFLQYDLYTGFMGRSSDHVLGKLVSIETYDADLQVTCRDEANNTVERLRSYYPAYKYWTATLREMPGALPEIWPQTGGFAMADFNGDGRMDAAAFIRQYDAEAQYACELRKAVFLQNANGTWTEKPLPIPENDMGQYVGKLIAVDLDQDGDMDLAACDGWKAYFLQNDGQGNFSSLATVPLGEGIAGGTVFFAMADFDNDGRSDFAMVNDTALAVIRQETPAKYTVYPVSKQYVEFHGPWVDDNLAVGDINGDGWTDIVTVGRDAPLLHINNGDLTFTDHPLPVPDFRCAALAVADADQDGCDDILYSGSPLSSKDSLVVVLQGRPNDASGHIQPPLHLPVDATFPQLWGGRVAWADLDGDGRLEGVISGTLGKSLSGVNTDGHYGENQVGKYYLHEYGKTYFKILKWDGEHYADAGIQLPGTVGCAGGALMAIADVDGDGRTDVVHGGAFCGRWEGGNANREVTGMKYLHNDIPAANQNPAAPTNLQAAVKGNGKVALTWTAGTDAETATDGLRYLVRVGTAAGKDDVVKGNTPFARKSGITLTHLPAQKLYCAVRTLDATGNLSPWSAETTFTSKGTTPTPVPVSKDSLPEIAQRELPENVNGVSADEEMGWASCSLVNQSNFLFRFEAGTYAYPEDAYRFAWWDGPVDEPLNHASSATLYHDATAIAHFLPDETRLQTSATATGYLDLSGNLWMYGSYNDATGAVTQDTPPIFSAQSNVDYFMLANNTAYFNRQGPIWYDCGDYSWYKYEYHHFPHYGYNQLLRALDGDIWYETPGSTPIVYLTDNTEFIEHAWGGPGGLAVLNQRIYEYNESIIRTLTVCKDKEEIGEARIDVPNLEDVIDCKLQEEFIVYLTSQGTVRGIGANNCGQLGRVAPSSLSVYATVPGLPCIVAITAGKAFCAALDKNGQVWTWGDNSCGQLGRQGGRSLSTPGKIPALDHIVAIAAGDNHLLALDANGTLHGWGDNAQGQLGGVTALAGQRVTAIAAAVNHSCALTADKKLYQWGDGNAAPQLLDDLSFQAASFTLNVDETCTTLMPMAAGSYVCRTGQEITLEAASDGEHLFQHWILNGETVEANPLKYTPTGNFTLKAVYALKPPLLTFGEPEINENTITVPVRMGGALSVYDGLDFTLQASDALVFSGVEFNYPYPQKTSHETAAGTSEDMIAYRFIAFGGKNLFDCEGNESMELCRVTFRRPAEAMQARFELTADPRLSRSRGAYSDAAAYGEPQTLILPLEEWQNDQAYEGRTMDTSSLLPGIWNPFVLPAGMEATTPAQLAQTLGVTGLTAWTWDGTQFRQTDALTPDLPMLLRFTGTPAKSIEYVPEAVPASELAHGWNLMMVQMETAAPQEASSVFRIDLRTFSNVRHEGALAPGELYWLYKDNQ